MQKNSCIKCDVCACAHHAKDNYCSLDCIKVTCDKNGNCTCCGSFCEKGCCE